MLLRHIYCCCNDDDVSPISGSKIETIEWNVLANQLTNAINDSMPIKIDDKCHNVASISKRSKHVTSPI
jgi:hypothetical protein